MLRFERPPKPEGFEAAVKPLEEKIQRLAKKRAPKSKEIDDAWSGYKDEFFRAQHRKCGYCEQKLGTHPGDVEHYRPKAELQELPEDKTRWGREKRDSFNVVGRRLDKFSDVGYWWLAYDWSNYLAACNRCNSGWKRNLFPVAENPRPKPECGQQETPLLLNPFDEKDPADHLRFSDKGLISALSRSRYGQATIDTCGLDRPSLVDARLEKARRAHALVREYYEAETVAERIRILARFMELGDESYVHAGMVRAIFTQKIDLSWDEVMAAGLEQ